MRARAEPIIGRQASSGVSIPTPLRLYTPTDAHPVRGSYFRSISVEALEKSAEAMSAGGSDLGDEIRRMNELSRQNSIQSSHQGEISVVRPRLGSQRSSRSTSYGRYGSGARYAYSPGGYVTSPVGSVSGSWSHASSSRVTSSSNHTSRLAQVSEPLQEGRPLDSPLRPSFSTSRSEIEGERSRDVSDSSFAKRYDEIAGQIEDSLADVPPSPPKDNILMHNGQHAEHLTVEEQPDRPHSTDTFREARSVFKDFDGVHFSPTTDDVLGTDEDGQEVRRLSGRHSSGGLSVEAASLLRTPRASRVPAAEPPPEENMIYYPAPVPRMLNLPKRLSQLPAANVQANRRSQVLGQLPPEARASAPWLAEEGLGLQGSSQRPGLAQTRGSVSAGAMPKPFLNERVSGNMSNVPPQLRATMFFEHQPIPQDVQVQSQSAVATLDSILAASATAPVGAFMDHPYAGDVRRSVYAAETTNRRSTTAPSSPESQEKTKRRSSGSFGALLRRRTASTDDLTEALQKRGSKSSLLTDLGMDDSDKKAGKKLQKRMSQMSVGDELDRGADPVRTPATELTESGLIASAQNANSPNGDRVISRPGTAMSRARLDDAEDVEDKAEEQDVIDDDAGGDAHFVQPSTLLAELQVRKAQLKSRNKTAATAFPKGMHSTLLELDAVEEISKRKRQKQRVNLAWEDPHQRALVVDLDENDEDVPLGMLFPSKDGKNHRRVGDGKDWDRPLGLMEKRELEDSEPLSNRLRRMRGVSPNKARAPSPEHGVGMLPSGTQIHLAGQPDAPDEANEEEGETLAQRLKRMKSKDALDLAISSAVPNDGERPDSTFADDVMSRFGVLHGNEDAGPGDPKATTPGPPDEEETLGQRRARLQREREANGESRNISDGSTRPPLLRSASSLANLLAANPVGPQKTTAKTHQPAQGTLLHATAQVQARQKSQLLDTNRRSSSYNLDKSLVDGRPLASVEQANATRGLLGQQHGSFAPSGGFGGGSYNNGMGGLQPHQPLQTSASTPMFGMQAANNYYSSPTAMAYAGGYGNGMMGPVYAPQVYAQPVYQPNPYAGVNGFVGNAYNPGMMGGTYASFAQQGSLGAMGMDGMDPLELNPTQRAAIDRWRMSVGQQ